MQKFVLYIKQRMEEEVHLGDVWCLSRMLWWVAITLSDDNISNCLLFANNPNGKMLLNIDCSRCHNTTYFLLLHSHSITSPWYIQLGRNVLLRPWLRRKIQVNVCQGVVRVHVMSPLDLCSSLQHAKMCAIQQTTIGGKSVLLWCVVPAPNALVSYNNIEWW